MGPRNPLSTLAVQILALLHKRDTPTDMLPLLYHTGKDQTEIEAALEELRGKKLAELRPRVSPPHWQICGV